jgi:glyoxylase-like metal-dependent hydrolase (beta-lactamase superfamily II)
MGGVMRKLDFILGLLTIAAVALGIIGAALPEAALAQSGKRAIENVKGDVYRFQNSFHYAIFVETADGIVVTDPINAEAVSWLKAELAKRFNKPVTHMILSHHHSDHGSGGEAWGSGLTVIAHEKAAEHIANGDVTTATPTKTFSDTMSFTAGGKTFELTYLGVGHSDDLIAVVVRPENVAFVVDAVSPRRVPYRDFPHTDIDKLIEQIKVVEGLDFEILAPGHGDIAGPQDATDMRVYIEELKAAVLGELKAGKAVDEIVASVTMEKYKDWGNRDAWLELNVRGMARWLVESGNVE